MNVPSKRSRCLYSPVVFFVWLVLMASGCAHVKNQAPGTAEVKQLVETSTIMEKRGDIVSAVEDLKIALAIDPTNAKALEELNRLVAKRNRDAEQHYRAGVAVRNSNAQAAQKEFLDALRLRPDHQEALTALRELQLAAAETGIQARLKKEAARTSIQVRPKKHADEEELDIETYSLDIAVSAFEDGDYSTAIREFSKMKSRYPNDPDIKAYLDRSWYNNGIDQFNTKNFRKALESFSKVPKGFDNVGDYMGKCKKALKPDTGKKVK